MRVLVSSGKFKAHAVAGTRAILIALDYDPAKRAKLLGFAFHRTGPDGKGHWLYSHKVFKSVVAKPDLQHGNYRTNQFPVQSFLWSDYTAEPRKSYAFKIHPVTGTPAAPVLEPPLELKVKTESEDGTRHGVWFNRGAIASQAYARQFKNHKPTEKELSNPHDKHTKWLSRGLLEACLNYIDTTKKTEKLRACCYEFTYQPVLKAFAAVIAKGIDVELIVHDDKAGKNRAAMKAAKLSEIKNGRKIVHWRTKIKIPHNKFIIKFEGDTPKHTWTGSTNFTSSGFLGQSNVGHLIHNTAVAQQYFKYWNIIKKNETAKPTKAAVVAISPYPPALPKENTITTVFSPRETDSMLQWYADRMDDASSNIMFTAAFTVSKDFVGPLSRDRDFLRFLLKEKPPTEDERKAFKVDRDLVVSYGAVLGAEFRVIKGKLVASRKVKTFGLEKWYFKEELTRSEGNIFFVHTKYLLIDALSQDPLICTGSANFSTNSLTGNDENMVLIRGDKRVADIYLSEFDRLFRHFYFRDVANEVASKLPKGKEPEKVYLDETFTWTDAYFNPGALKTRRREMFFNLSKKNWTSAASKRSSKEPVRPKNTTTKAAAKK